MILPLIRLDVANENRPHNRTETAVPETDQVFRRTRAEPAAARQPAAHTGLERMRPPRGQNRLEPGRQNQPEANGLLTVAKFTIEVDFDGSHSAMAYRAIIGKALDDCRQVVRSSAKMQDELKVPVAHVPDPQKIGHWKIEL
jgi:hypothetical protein